MHGSLLRGLIHTGVLPVMFIYLLLKTLFYYLCICVNVPYGVCTLYHSLNFDWLNVTSPYFKIPVLTVPYLMSLHKTRFIDYVLPRDAVYNKEIIHSLEVFLHVFLFIFFIFPPCLFIL
jgi:hypothetical protein